MIKKAKSISEIYEQIKDFELVITNDAPLNTALNKRINQPKLGSFALTSRLLGSKYCDYLFEEEKLDTAMLVLKTKTFFNLNLKEAFFYINNILNIWQYTGSLQETKKFVSKKEQEFIDFLEKLPTYQLAQENMNIDFLNLKDKNNIAILGENLFSNLDKKVVSSIHKKIDFFQKNNNHQIEPIHVFNSKEDIIKSLLELINNDNLNHIAIVLNTKSDYLPLIKANLINKNIKINEKELLKNNFQLREFFSIIDLVLSNYNIYIKDIISIAQIFKIDIKTKYSNYLFKQLIKINKQVEEFEKILKEIEDMTYEQIIIFIHKFNIFLPKEFIHIIEELNLNKKKINSENFEDLKYFIENFEIYIHKNKSGVLLVDCLNSTFIDREIIFYIGVDNTWVRNIPNQSFINKKLELEKDLDKFQILIQQGIQRFFFIPKITAGEKTSPPIYFNLLFNDNLESYENNNKFKTIFVQNSFQDKCVQNCPTSQKAALIQKQTISNSGLKTFTQCPKKYAFSQLISGSDFDFFLKGELIHSFAEFYVNHKEFVKEKTIEEFVEIIFQKLKSLSNPNQNNILKTNIKFACISVISFIDKLKIQDDFHLKEFSEISKKNQENIFSNHFKKKINKQNAELKFKDSKLKLNGIIDLAVNKELIIDYKTGKIKSTGEIIKNSDLNNLNSNSDFQPLVYLSVFRKINPNNNISFWYHFPMINTYEQLTNKELKEEIVRVNYIYDINQYIQTKDFHNYYLDMLKKDEKELFEEFSSIHFFKNLNLNKINKEEIEEKFVNFHIQKGLKETKKNRNNCINLLTNILKFKTKEKIGNKNQKEVFYFKNDLDKFEEFVKDKLNQVNNSYKTNFDFKPIEEEKTCETCEFKKICIKKF